MQILVTVIHCLVGLFLILVVLLQSGKGGGMGAAFGGASSGVFGARGANPFLSKLTAGCAVAFFITSITLSVMSSKVGSVMGDEAKAAAATTAPSDANLEAGKAAAPAGDAAAPSSQPTE